MKGYRIKYLLEDFNEEKTIKLIACNEEEAILNLQDLLEIDFKIIKIQEISLGMITLDDMKTVVYNKLAKGE